MVSSPVDNRLWTYRVPNEQIINAHNKPYLTCVYGDANMANHQPPPGEFYISHSVKTRDGATINIGDMAFGYINVDIWYPDGLGAHYDVQFPRANNLNDIEAYALDIEHNKLYIRVDKRFYVASLVDDDGYPGDVVFKAWNMDMH